jgi:hypothetical protein
MRGSDFAAHSRARLANRSDDETEPNHGGTPDHCSRIDKRLLKHE